jgi:hypothetical protein
MSKSAAFIGEGEGPERLNLRLASHHGLIAGAIGAGKTVGLEPRR